MKASGEPIDGLRQYVVEAMRVTGTPGVSLALARNGTIFWQAAFGCADLAARVPMSPDTVVCAGSMAKTYVAIAALQLVDAGLMDLHEPVERYLPDLPVRNPLGERSVTPYDLLTYRSGLATDTGDCLLEPPDPLREWLRDELARDESPEYGHGTQRWTAKVGDRFQYSSLGIAIVGLLVEALNPDGLSFDAYVRGRIIDPLGLRSTDLPRSFRPADVRSAIRTRLATGYARFGPVLVAVPLLHSGSFPAITLLTTAADEALLLEVIAQGGELHGIRVVSPESVRLMLSPHVATGGDVPGPDGFYGMGLQLKRMGEPTFSFGHGGTHPYGWWSEAHCYPRLGLTVVVCANKRNMLGWYNPEAETAPGLVHQYIVDRLAQASAGKRGPTRSWSWKASYVIGVLMVERLLGTLGVGTALPRRTIDAMARGARTVSDDGGSWRFDQAAFKLGVWDMLSVDPSPDGIRAFLSGEELRVDPAELRLLWLEFGRPGRSPAPIRFWAAAQTTRHSPALSER
jgi:CubicO group peptidase (beta-lactamase class C family)